MSFQFRQTKLCTLMAVCGALLAFAAPAGAFSALDMGTLDTAGFDSIAGSVHSTLTSSYDFIPEAVDLGDGQVTSTVYNGIGAASGLYIYTYTIELFASEIASVGAVVGMTFQFGSLPTTLAGIGQAFYVDDGSANKAPDLAIYDDASETAGFRILPSLTNGESSFLMGLISPNAPAVEVAQLIDSGALGGQTTVLSNGAPPLTPIPEPGAALLFGVGFAVVAHRCRKRA